MIYNLSLSVPKRKIKWLNSYSVTARPSGRLWLSSKAVQQEQVKMILGNLNRMSIHWARQDCQCMQARKIQIMTRIIRSVLHFTNTFWRIEGSLWHHAAILTRMFWWMSNSASTRSKSWMICSTCSLSLPWSDGSEDNQNDLDVDEG